MDREKRCSNEMSSYPIIAFSGIWQVNLFRRQEGQLLVYDDQMVAVIGEVPENLSADAVVSAKITNYRVYFEEVQSMNYSSKKDGSYQIVLTANGFKHIFISYDTGGLEKLKTYMVEMEQVKQTIREEVEYGKR